MKIMNWHDKNYKKLLVIPIIILLLSLTFLGIFYSNNGSLIKKDISLTGGTSATIYEKISPEKIEQDLSNKLDEINTRKIYDIVTKEQKAIIIETKSDQETTKQVLEDYLEYELTTQNSSFEFNQSSFSKGFFKELILAIIYAFTFMGVVVFLIFGKNKKFKALLIILASLPPLLFFGFNSFSISSALILSLAILLFTLGFYVKHNVPSFAVIVSAFADILMTVAFVNILGISVSSAGIIAFLMIIGYSVDTDILLTNRVLKTREGSINDRIKSSFRTGITMTLTSLSAFTIALIIANSFSVVLAQIFTILVIGLFFDILNTWITNVSIIKWYANKNEN